MAISPQDLVIIVDDDAAVRTSLTFQLEIDGYAVRAYSAPGQVLGEAELPRCGCLLVDYHLPGTNGLALIDQLRHRGVTLPAILITSAPSAVLRERAAAAGTRIVEKPLLGDVLADALQEAFAQVNRPLPC